MNFQLCKLRWLHSVVIIVWYCIGDSRVNAWGIKLFLSLLVWDFRILCSPGRTVCCEGVWGLWLSKRTSWDSTFCTVPADKAAHVHWSVWQCKPISPAFCNHCWCSCHTKCMPLCHCKTAVSSANFTMFSGLCRHTTLMSVERIYEGAEDTALWCSYRISPASQNIYWLSGWGVMVCHSLSLAALCCWGMGIIVMNIKVVGKFQRDRDKFKIFVKTTACAYQDSARDAINPSCLMWVDSQLRLKTSAKVGNPGVRQFSRRGIWGGNYLALATSYFSSCVIFTFSFSFLKDFAKVEYISFKYRLSVSNWLLIFQ